MIDNPGRQRDTLEMFVRLLRYNDAALAPHPQSHLFNIAANVVNGGSEPATDLPMGPENQPKRSVEHTLVNIQVRNAVSKLPQRPREVLLLHIRDNPTCEQIAARLNLTPDVVMRDMARAYAQLRRSTAIPIRAIKPKNWELRAQQIAVN